MLNDKIFTNQSLDFTHIVSIKLGKIQKLKILFTSSEGKGIVNALSGESEFSSGKFSTSGFLRTKSSDLSICPSDSFTNLPFSCLVAIIRPGGVRSSLVRPRLGFRSDPVGALVSYLRAVQAAQGTTNMWSRKHLYSIGSQAETVAELGCPMTRAATDPALDIQH